ncbi:MAG: ABC transporter permease [Candidatus Puniceispirillales bacterium]|jgi:simple sugar transport system permease protein|tara:strand:+ start:1098 stop:2675 length:1578 start_codon:yes stop_codon:yes gene_type:complete
MNNRSEADRLGESGWFSSLVKRPEIGPLGVMLLLFGMLGYFSIPAGEFSFNPFAGDGFNALGIRNNFRVVAQLGIIAIGAGLLIISGEFDLSIGSMMGFAAGVMAIILRWGFSIVIPYVSFDGGVHVETITLLRIENVSPIGAFLITLCFTLAFGWFQGWVIVKSGISSFIVTLGGLFFLRGATETIYRAFNKPADQSAGSTTVTDLPDFKNIINVPGHGEMERVEAKSLPNQELLELLKQAPVDLIEKLRNNLLYINEKVAATKTLIEQEKMTSTLLKTLEKLKSQGRDEMAAKIQERIDAGAGKAIINPKEVTDLDLVRAYIDTLPSARPVADFFGGDILEPIFQWLYFTADWNVNMFGNQFAPGLYACVMIWILLAIICYFVLSKTQAGNWIYSTGGNLNAAKANGVPTNKVKISLFIFSAFCATLVAATQVFEVNTADTAKGTLKELEAIAAAVIGGVVLTGGFGTVLGIVLGTIIFGISKEAFFYIPGIDGSFYRVFLGVVIVSAALANENIRKRIIGSS